MSRHRIWHIRRHTSDTPYIMPYYFNRIRLARWFAAELFLKAVGDKK